MWTRLFSTPWIGCFILAAACFGLQLSPLGFLFVFVTFYPSVLFLNLGFILVGVDAWRGRLPHTALIVPCLWFGGYYAAALLSHAMALDLPNNAVDLSWTRSTPIVVTSDSDIASGFLDDYGLDEVFMRSAPGGSETRRLRLVRGRCDDRSVPDAIFNSVTDGGYGTGRPARMAIGLCKAYDHHEPGSAPIQIAVGSEVFGSGLMGGYTQAVSITVPGRSAVTLQATGPSWTLPWIPMLEIGCHLRGGFGDRWDNGCSVRFLKRQQGGTGQDAVTVAARALGLHPVKIKDRYRISKWRCLDALRAGRAPPPASYCVPE